MFSREAMALPGNTRWSIIYASFNDQFNNSGFQSWTKPRGITFVYFLAISPGDGGGMVNSGANTTAGSGGSSGNVYSFLIPSIMLPEVIYVQPGKGGLGATTSGAGGSGDTLYITANTDISGSPEIIFYAAPTLGGGAGFYQFSMGLIGNIFYPGQAGASGATVANGSGLAPTWGGGGIFLGGGSGGGCGTGAGGTINTGSLDIPLISGGTGTTGENGSNGFGYNKPIVLSQNNPSPLPLIAFTGGAGGGGHTNGQAGRGGNGAYGCGGGGGGSATLAGGLAGQGGNGGDGLVIIGAF